MEESLLNLIIITGFSGAGKSLAIRYYEDMGYFCIDNLPVTLIPKLVELCLQSDGKIKNVALVIDIRGKEFFDSLKNSLETVHKMGVKEKIIFLEATEEVLIRRYEETRRPHPLGEFGTLSESIRKEKRALEPIREMADYVIDTSRIPPSQLKEVLQKLSLFKAKDTIVFNLVSFGYKFGIPLDADLILDVRFLNNPFYEPELKYKSGLDKEVKDYVMGDAAAEGFLERVADLIEFLVPQYIRLGKDQITIGIGCTGGRHRSPAIVDVLRERLEDEGYRVTVTHRDIEAE
ncbi:MAG TPA: RNase adapter RapZ [bacterium]|nr:RNase adapter RapZ [bacterium]